MQIEFKRASNSYILISLMRVAIFFSPKILLFLFLYIDFVFILYLISILMMWCTTVPKINLETIIKLVSFLAHLTHATAVGY